MKEVAKYTNCFVCGDKNPIGLKAKFWYDQNQVTTSLEATERFEGYRGIYHGGIIATMLVEVMIKAVLALDIFAVTAEISIRFKRPVQIGTRLEFVGRITQHKGRVFVTAGEVSDSDGNLYATANAKYIKANGELQQSLEASLE